MYPESKAHLARILLARIMPCPPTPEKSTFVIPIFPLQFVVDSNQEF
jgi:hypothetical protein